MKTNLLTTFFFVSLILVSASSSLAQEIGSGYSCSGSTILRNGRVVSLSAAKSAIQAKIDALGSSAKNKNKKNALKAVKKGVINCSKGIPPVVAAGTYTGTISGSYTKSSSSLCESRTSITGSFVVTGSGSNLVSTAVNNPLRVYLKGSTGVNEFSLNGASGILFREFWEVKATDVTSTSATFSVKYRGVKIASRTRQAEVCKGSFTGVMTKAS